MVDYSSNAHGHKRSAKPRKYWCFFTIYFAVLFLFTANLARTNSKQPLEAQNDIKQGQNTTMDR